MSENLTYLRELFFSSFKNVNKETGNEIVDRYINISYLEVYRDHHWEYRKRTGQVVLIPNYTTGNCSVTRWDGTSGAENAAKTVAFSGATLTDNMRGRFLQVGSSSYWHKIVYREGNTLYLDTPIVDVPTGSGLSFVIWKQFYYIKSDADVVLDFDRWGTERLGYRSDAELTDQISNLATTGAPYLFSPYGIDPYEDIEYTTGTITVTSNSNLVSGTNTAWLSSGVDTGDILQIGSVDYYIKRVETDTRIILFNTIEESVPADSTYSIRKNNPLGFRFYNPSDDYRILPYSYLSKGYPLIHPADDRIQLPREFIPAIISRAVYFRMKDVDDSRWGTMLQIYEAEMTGLRRKWRVVKPRYLQFAPQVRQQMPGRG